MAISIKKKEIRELEINAVRRCSTECYFFKNGGKGCTHFQQKTVVHGDSCIHDLLHLKAYADAFSNGNLDYVKKDASGVTGMVMMLARRMLETVSIEGPVIEEPMVDARGQPVWIPDPAWVPTAGAERPMIVAMRKVDHPLIARAIQTLRGVGINLAEFKLTPKSADEKKMVSGHIIVENPEDIKTVMDERKKIDAKFLAAVHAGNKRTHEDPVYIKLLEDGDIVK